MSETMHICEPEEDKIVCWSGDVDIEDDEIKSIKKSEKIGEFDRVLSPVLEGRELTEENTLIIGPEREPIV